MLCIVMFQELCVVVGDIIEVISFVHNFYASKPSFSYKLHNLKGDVIILLTMGTPQGGPFGEPLFALAHLWGFQFALAWFPTCLSFTIVNDTHIISHIFKVWATFKYLTLELNAIGFSIQLHKCIVWSMSCIPNDFILLTLFSTPSNGPKVCGYSNEIHHIHFFFH